MILRGECPIIIGIGWMRGTIEWYRLPCIYISQSAFPPGSNSVLVTYPSSILPALAFSLDMFTKTNMSYGVNEVLLASVLGAVLFAIFAAQPLVIVGVTGRERFKLFEGSC